MQLECSGIIAGWPRLAQNIPISPPISSPKATKVVATRKLRTTKLMVTAD
jgi:hypothetical protein